MAQREPKHVLWKATAGRLGRPKYARHSGRISI